MTEFSALVNRVTQEQAVKLPVDLPTQFTSKGSHYREFPVTLDMSIIVDHGEAVLTDLDGARYPIHFPLHFLTIARRRDWIGSDAARNIYLALIGYYERGI